MKYIVALLLISAVVFFSFAGTARSAEFRPGSMAVIQMYCDDLDSVMRYKTLNIFGKDIPDDMNCYYVPPVDVIVEQLIATTDRYEIYTIITPIGVKFSFAERTGLES